MTLHDRLHAGFVKAFGVSPAGTARAPGRVNLIGEHTDYNDGFVLPIAITAETRVAFRARDDGLVRVAACDFDDERDEFDLRAPIVASASRGWRNYVRGTLQSLADRGWRLHGMDLAIAGDLPRGSGLSSSASLEIAVGLAATTIAAAPATPLQLALAGQQAEHDLVGVRCGIMDQLASAACSAGAAALIDCRSLAVTPVPVPPGAAIAIVPSGVERGLVEGHYNQRRAECEEAVGLLGVRALRDATLAGLSEARASMSDAVFRRARHVISENGRVQAAAAALLADDLAGFGRLMADSHASMRDDFAITVPAVDQLVGIAQSAVGALAGGSGGARMTGGGFGGAVVVLAPADRMAAVLERVTAEYRTPSGEQTTAIVTQPAAGASLL